MENIIIQTSQDNSTWTDLKTPSAFKVSYEDLDNDSYRSVTNGNLVRRRIKPRWVKLDISYNLVSDTELDTIARAINTNQKFYVKAKSPAFGTTGLNNTWVQFRAYCSKYEAEMIDAQKGWKLSFSIVQSDGGNFQ